MATRTFRARQSLNASPDGSVPRGAQIFPRPPPHSFGARAAAPIDSDGTSVRGRHAVRPASTDAHREGVGTSYAVCVVRSRYAVDTHVVRSFSRDPVLAL